MKDASKIVSRSFTVKVETMPSRLRWVIARVPVDVKKTWGSAGLLKVRGDINGYPFRTSLFPGREGGHFLLVNKKMQAGAGVTAGDKAKVTLENDIEERTVTTPPELARELKQDRALTKWYDALNYSTHKYIADWISEPKSADAKKRRAEQIAERLYLTMDAERELPPLLQQAFARRPRAFLGWKRMSASQRRQELLAIFYYRNPESRARRIDKMMDAAEARVDKAHA